MTLQNIGIAISVIVIVSFIYYYYYTSTKENFGDYPRSIKIQRTTIPEQTSFVSVPSFQSMIAPRFQSTPYSANIRYKSPEYKNTAVPSNPLGYVTEKFMGNDQGGNLCTQCKNYGCGDTCSQTGMSSSGLINTGINKYSTTNMSSSSSTSKPVVLDALPVGSMTTMSEDGNVEQHNVYDRLIVSNKKSRLLEHNDYIRGSLAIAPNNTGWFQVSANPVTDLKLGYMNCVAGTTTDNNQSFADLMLKYGGNASLIGGFGTNSMTTTLSQAGDVAVTAFP